MRTILEFVLGSIDAAMGPINAAMGALPLWSARVAVALLLILPAVAVWRLSRDWVLRGAPDRAKWRDLRIWAALFIVPYLVIYLLLA